MLLQKAFKQKKKAHMDPTNDLSRRERQIMQAVFAKGSATAKEIVAAIPDPPSRTAVRTMLTILVDKKLLKHHREGREFVYSPTSSKEKASRGALENVLQTFFGGSIENLIASHFSDPKSKLDAESLKRMEQMIKEARKNEG
jgi:predicted transcriptional regulator